MISAEEFLSRRGVDVNQGMDDRNRGSGVVGAGAAHAGFAGDAAHAVGVDVTFDSDADAEAPGTDGCAWGRRGRGGWRGRPAARGRSGAEARGGCRRSRRGGFENASPGAGIGAGVEDPKDLDACREAALRLLDAAPRASGALRERLVAKGYDADVADDVIERLTRVQLLDDDSYARSAVRYCAGRLLGARATVTELTRKGVDRRLAQQVVSQAEEDGVFEEAAWELGHQYARKTQGMDPDKRRQRFWSAGGRKGHSPETLQRISRELFA